MNKTELLKRGISSLVLIALTVAAIKILWLFAIVSTTLIILALNEFFAMVESHGIKVFRYFGILLGAVIPISVFFRFELTKGWELLFISLALIALFLLQISRQKTTASLEAVALTVFGILYISWLFSFIIKLRFLPYGAGLVAMLILSVKSSDIGAYLIGSKFGRTPLIKEISPKKTVEGALGGFAFSIIFCLLSKFFLPVFTYVHLLFLGITLGILALLGDLSESLIKRDCQAKDSGSLLPGLGGVLDVLDSLLFSAPVLYFYAGLIFK